MRKGMQLLAAVLVALALLVIPPEWIPIQGLTVVQQRVVAIFALAAILWITEPIPIYATSLLVTVLLLGMVSDASLLPLRQGVGAPGFGTLLRYQAIMATFASPIVMLFLGGFFLALAAAKYRLDLNLARVLLKPFGQDPRFVLMGMMGITALFSMFISNTATTALVLALLAPILGAMREGDRGRTAFALAVPFSANVGGIGTIIGTPPNAIATRYLRGDAALGFGEWMAFAVPFVLILLVFVWYLLLKAFPVQTERIELEIGGAFATDWRALTVYATFAVTVLLWLTDGLHGLNAYVVAMLPVAVFSATAIVARQDLAEIRWDILWLIAGGIALGLALEETGLAVNLVASIPFAAFPPLLTVAGLALLTTLMSNFMSNTATANLLLPIVAALGATVPELAGVSGSRFVILAVTFSASLSMVLPISTPPNALAYGSGYFTTRDMARMGILIGAVGLALAYAYLYLLTSVAGLL